MEYLKNLNDDQKAVVLHTSGPMAVISGAGVGKTHTIVSKITYLLDQVGVLPTRIVTVTLTKKAAEELKERVGNTIDSKKAEKLRISTIHSFAYKTYRACMEYYDPRFKAPKILINDFEPFLPLLNYAKKIKLGNKQIVDHLSFIKQNKVRMITPKEYAESIKLEELLAKADGNLENLRFEACVYYTWVEYEKYLAKHNKMDFEDIIVNCYKCLINPNFAEFKEVYSKKIEYLIVDEAQDTTELAFKIFEQLREVNKNITIVGDLRQCIFSFMGAYVHNIPNFVSKYRPEVIDLKTNYRSTKTIVETANHFIKKSKYSMGQPSITPNEKGHKISFSTHTNEVSEAEWIVDKIQALLQSGEDPKEIAVIHRINSQARAIEDNFLLYNIPYISYSDQAFYQRKESKDLLAYLRLMNNWDGDMDIEDLKRICNRPNRFIKSDIIADIGDYAFEYDTNLFEAFKNIDFESYYQQGAVSNLFSQIRVGAKKIKEGETPQQIIDYILHEMGYSKWANEEKGIQGADADVVMDLDAIMNSASKHQTIDAFFSFINKVLKKEKEKKDENAPLVRLMSIHKSKGKEFKHVFVIGLCDRCYPFYKSKASEYDLEEERRIMYVAITRPKKFLHLSAIDGSIGSFKVRPSKYLYDMDIGYTPTFFDGFEVNNESNME